MPPKIVQRVAVFLLIVGPVLAIPPAKILQPEPDARLTDYEKMTLEVCRSIVLMFRDNPSAV